MTVILRRTESLIPYEFNPRVNDDAVKYVVNSIRQFGFKVPIIIDKNNVVVAGHTRLKAAKEIGMDEVPVIVADDLTDEQIKAFRLADNKTAEMSKWDFGFLQKELDELGEMSLDFDMSDFGFDLADDSIMIDEDSEVAEPDDYDEKKEKVCTCPNCGLKFAPIMENE